MPFKSKKQRKWMHANKPKMAKKWEKEEKSVEEDRDYKDEYKKFQSSDKAKKYRSELNQYNRKKGTYGNGDGKDASHKGGKIVGFESQSKNRGRAEKSRLKKEDITMLEAKFTDDTLAPRIKHWASKHKGTGIGYGHVLGQLAVHMKEMGWNKSYKEVARIAVELGKKKKVESVNEGGMGILSTDQADILQGIVLRNKNKNLKAILKVALKSGYFKGVDKKELLGYIDGAKQFVKYMKSHPMESVNESGILYKAGVKKYGKEGMRKIQQAAGKRKSHAEIGKIKDKYEKESVKEFIKLFQKTAIKKAIVIAKKMKGNMTGAVKKIEKMNRGLSDQPQVAAALRKANESVNEMPNFDRGTSGLPKGFTDDYYKIVKKLSKGKGYLTLSKSDKKKVWATLGKIYTESINEVKKLSQMNNKELIKHWVKKSKELEVMKSRKEIDKFAYRVESGKIARILNHLWGLQKDMKEEGFGGELKGKDKQKFEKARKENAEVLGFKLTGITDIKEVVNFSKTSTKKLVKTYKQMADERLSGSAALTFRLIAKELIKRKARLESVNEKMDREQFQDYIQYVLKTQFKTPEEKKMKKSIIKKLNIANKKKGLPLFKERTQSIGGEELLKFLMKRFKMSKSQAIVSMKKHKMDMSFLKKESVNEVVEPAGNMAKIQKIVKDKQATKLGGVMIDMQSANLLMKLWDAVSDKDKEKMNKLNPKVLATVIKKLWSRVNLKLPI
jgi:hypothetical protein